MADITVRYFSDCLKRQTQFQMYLPNDMTALAPWDEQKEAAERPMKTLVLLHGYTGCAENYMPQEIAQKYNFAVVCPNGENSFWLDCLSTGRAFCRLLGEEIPNYLRKTFGLAKSAEETFIMGLSMGGFGALHTGLRYPDVYGKIGAMSSALIVHEVAVMEPGSDNGVANYDYYRECFGEPAKLLESDNNPETLVDKLLAEGRKLPEIYMCCGTEDFLIENNRGFHSFLESRSVPHEYIESPGIHDWPFWKEYCEKIADWMFGE